jgi:hypothetical protein
LPHVMVRVNVSGMVMTGVLVRVEEKVRVRVWDDGEGDCLGGVMVWARVLVWVLVRVSV